MLINELVKEDIILSKSLHFLEMCTLEGVKLDHRAQW